MRTTLHATNNSGRSRTDTIICKSRFQLQITASVRKQPLRPTWALLSYSTSFAATVRVRELTLLLVTERGFRRE